MIVLDKKHYDVMIVGGGPAGLTASIYCARAGLETAVVEKEMFGGRITSSPKVVNIPGFVEISGVEFGENLTNQAEALGAELVFDEVKSIEKIGNGFLVKCDSEEYMADVIILATGTRNRNLGLGEENLKGIAYCVTCDGPFYKDKDVVVVGGGNSAVTEAIELSGIAKNVTIVQNMHFLTCEKALQAEVKKHENVRVLCGYRVLGYDVKDGRVVGIKVANDTEDWVIKVDGVFLAVGLEPQNKPFENIVELDEKGYIKSAESGVFYCGDCKSESRQQVSVACGSGTIAALDAIKWIRGGVS